MLEPLTRDLATRVLREHLHPEATCTGVQRGPIGNGQETWFLEVAPEAIGPLVLRRTAEAGPLEWTDRAAEGASMALAVDLGLPVPRIHWIVPDAHELGAPYLVMDRAPGRSAMTVRGGDRATVAADLGRRLAALHLAAAPDPRGRSATTATRDELARWRDHYRDNRVTPVPLVDALLAWCDANVPDLDEPAILLWGDAGAHNTLTDGQRVTAMLDWELSHHGHPVEDLASAIWIEGDAGTEPDVVIDAWEEATGATVDRAVLDYFLAMVCITRSVMITVGAGAFVRGRTAAPHLAGLGLHLPGVNLPRAARLAGWDVDKVASDDVGASRAAHDPPGPGEDLLRPTGDEIDTGIARFLRDDVLALVDDPRTRRGLKTAAALLETAALRARVEAEVTRDRRRRTRELLDDLDLGDDLATVAARVETEVDLAHLRPRVRAHLLADHAAQRHLLAPLTELYER